MVTLCHVFGVHRSSYRYWKNRPEKPDGRRAVLRSQVLELHGISHGSAGARSIATMATRRGYLNRPGFPGECFICELRLPDHRFRWKHNKLFLLLPEEYGPAFPAIVDCYTSPPT